MNADNLLRRLADLAPDILSHHQDMGKGTPELCRVCVVLNDLTAYLSREKGPVVSVWITFEKFLGDWYVDRVEEDPFRHAMEVRLPVPAHLLNPAPIEGEVVEGE